MGRLVVPVSRTQEATARASSQAALGVSVTLRYPDYLGLRFDVDGSFGRSVALAFGPVFHPLGRPAGSFRLDPYVHLAGEYIDLHTNVPPGGTGQGMDVVIHAVGLRWGLGMPVWCWDQFAVGPAFTYEWMLQSQLCYGQLGCESPDDLRSAREAVGDYRDVSVPSAIWSVGIELRFRPGVPPKT
jgi:hypothetical protein